MKVTLLICFLLPFCTFGQMNNTDSLRQKALVLRRFLEQNHYQPITWNDTTSQRLYNRWLNLLDDDKLIFCQTDIKQLAPLSTRLDDELLGREWNFFDKGLALYKAGLQRADSIISAILSKPFDFSAPDELKWPLAGYTNDAASLYQAWQKYLKWKVLRTAVDLLTDSAGNLPDITKPATDFTKTEIKARLQIKMQEQLWVSNKQSVLIQTKKELEDNYLSAIAWCYDPHTEYMSADTKNDFETEMTGLEFSAGFEMNENEKNEWEITYLVPGGPAWRNGELHKGDVVLKIKSGNKQATDMATINEQQLNQIFESNGNEKLTLTVRTISGAQKTVTLTKEKITNEEGIVKSYILKGTKKIGYITLPGFYMKEGDDDVINGCSNDVAKEVVKLKKDSIAGLILDLRFNGGGSLGEALELAGIFINEGPLSSTKDKNGKVHFLRDPNRGTIYDGPLLVMTNTLSASASEMVAAVLQDYHRALIAGSTTYGKGTEQAIMPMDTTGRLPSSAKYKSYVKVTDGKFYRVDGTSTQWKGVVPDIDLPDVYAMDRFREKANVSALQPDNAKVAIYYPLPAIPIGPLKEKSNVRVAADSNFKKVSIFANWFKSMQDQRVIPLQWKTYLIYFKNIKDMYALVESNKKNHYLVAVNNSMDAERQRLITEQSKSINEVNIKRIESDNYISECYKIMQDWLQ